MKRFLSMAAAAAVLAAAAGCASGNGSESGPVRVATNAQDVAGCEKLTQVRLQGTWTAGAGRAELEKLVSAKGGNVLLLTDGSSTTDSGSSVG